jgi:hypothetical protein
LHPFLSLDLSSLLTLPGRNRIKLNRLRTGIRLRTLYFHDPGLLYPDKSHIISDPVGDEIVLQAIRLISL